MLSLVSCPHASISLSRDSACPVGCFSLEHQHFINPAEIRRLFLSGEFLSVIVLRKIHCCGPAPDCYGTHPAPLPFAPGNPLRLRTPVLERARTKD